MDSATIKTTGICTYCKKPSQSNFEKWTIELVTGDDGHLSAGTTRKKLVPLCFEHKAEYIRHLDAQKDREIQNRYDKYVEWCDKCGFISMSLDKFTEEKHYKEWV